MNVLRLNPGFWLGGMIIWVVTVSVFCLMPLDGVAPSLPYADKLGHIAFFSAGAFWLFLRLPRRLLPVVAGMSALLLFGILIEACQSLTAYRSAEFLDVVADGTGVGLGWLAQAWLMPMSAAAEKRVP